MRTTEKCQTSCKYYIGENDCCGGIEACPEWCPQKQGNISSWDKYFLGIAEAISQKSHCLSHKFGAVAVINNHMLSSGYNGPPRHYHHCDNNGLTDECPRHRFGYKSGQGLELCPAAHAESNVLVNAAKYGVALNGATLYVTSPTPCRECSKLIVNAGITRVVISNDTDYPDIGLTGRQILDECGVKVDYCGR